jgi:rhodanese-related sulfurtransferase
MKKSSHIWRLIVALLAGFSLVSLAACAGDSRSTESTTLKDATPTIIDVRSPEEFAAGHLEGAINLDYEGGTLEAELGSLDQGSAYIVYCQSGRRSALATTLMTEAGFTEVADLGGIDAAAVQTDLRIVTN